MPRPSTRLRGLHLSSSVQRYGTVRYGLSCRVQSDPGGRENVALYHGSWVPDETCWVTGEREIQSLCRGSGRSSQSLSSRRSWTRQFRGPPLLSGSRRARPGCDPNRPSRSLNKKGGDSTPISLPITKNSKNPLGSVRRRVIVIVNKLPLSGSSRRPMGQRSAGSSSHLHDDPCRRGQLLL